MTKSESQSTIVLTVDDARLAARSVAVRWHRASEKTGTPPGDGVAAAQPAGYKITYNFLTDWPSTFTYHARVGRDRATRLVDARGSKSWPSDGHRACTTTGYGVVSVQAQLMANCPVSYYEDTEYDGRPPVGRLLRWAVATLAAGALWVSGICGPRDEVASVTAQLMAGCRVIQYDESEYDGCPPAARLLRCVSGQPRWSYAVEQRRAPLFAPYLLRDDNRTRLLPTDPASSPVGSCYIRPARPRCAPPRLTTFHHLD